MIATSATDPTICTWPSLFVQMFVCIKEINKNCATFLIKKDKNHLYYILSYFGLYLFAFFFFSTIKRQL